MGAISLLRYGPQAAVAKRMAKMNLYIEPPGSKVAVVESANIIARFMGKSQAHG